MNKEYKIKLDLNKKLYNKKMAFNQFDENVNDFYIEVTKNNKVVKDLDKSIITLVAIKPNSEVDAQFIEVKEGQIYANLKPSMCDLVGNYQAKAMIVLEGEIVTTDTINYSVNEDKIISRLNDDIVSDERFTLFTDALARLSTIESSEEQRIVNEAERILAEENRKIEEAKRVEAELIRQHEEADRSKYDATRESNENIRKQNESIRLANETNRIDEEAKRVEEENKRKLAEEERNANYNFMTEDEERRRSEANAHKEAEVLRVQAETNRVNEEAKRRTTEQARVSAENIRVSNENTRKANEETRQSNETKRVEAETQRQSRYNSFITDAEANANNFENYTNNAKVKEEERKSNELDRKSQEDRRVSNEVERISNENTRKANEEAREKNETSRQYVFENKVDEVDKKIVELNTTKDNFVSSINTKVDNKISEIEVAKSDMTNTVSSKVNEVETRFNALTSKQQQDAEVIDARDGETSLKARLDRDIEKAKQIYVNVEGNHISTDSNVGYLKDVEILGNTIQDASNLADIRSVGDTVEGQELYEIPVLSVGKNLFSVEKCESYFTGYASNSDITFTSKQYSPNISNIKNNTSFTLTGTSSGGNGVVVNYVKLVKDKSYRLSITKDTTEVRLYVFNDKGLHVKNIATTSTNAYLDFVASSEFMYIGVGVYDVRVSNIYSLQLEEGTVATPYEPYQEDKLTILSPVQLEKVGDVADRIICKDGVWGVEKSITQKLDLLKATWIRHVENDNNLVCKTSTYSDVVFKEYSDKIISNFTASIPQAWNGQTVGISTFNDGWIYLCVPKTLVPTIDNLSTYLNNVGAYAICRSSQPRFIPLPHSQQIKLRTFANKTNISFGCEIEGTIKAQVPKSLGATVNTHTEQIRSLNNELNRVKKLEESTVSTVTTESNFTTVEATSNGYFEDVKLEGKTLVNLVIHNNLYFKRGISVAAIGTDLTPTINNNLDNRSSRCTYKVSVKPNTIYTIIHCNSNIDTFHSIVHSSNNIIVEPYATWVNNKTFETGATTDTVWIHLRVDANNTDFTSIDQLQNHLIILEGDYTQNPPSFFEGLKSVGQSATTSEDGVDEVVVSSVKGDGNLVEYIELNGVTGGGEDYLDNLYVRTNYITVEPNQTYYIKSPTNVLYKNYVVYFYDSNKSYLGHKIDLISEFTTIANTKFIRFDMRKVDGSPNTQEDVNKCDFVVSKYRVSEYIPHISDKKRLLYYNNETQAWEKPILRQWDSIEKHANGKYYYHQRSGEIVLNGSESWYAPGWSTLEPWISNNPNGFAYETHISITGKSCDTPVICNKFNSKSIPNSSALSIGYCTLFEKYLSFATTAQSTIDQWKNELQTNPVTVVYQLAQEKVYECTNIDLITYSGETNYIVESGAIVPKTTLKVHNNISNVVSLLQKKVSLLESNITSYMITQNRLMLASRYNADTVSFKVDVATLRNSFEYDNDLYELILNNILVGKDNYNREYIENLIIFYWMDFVISDEMHSTLFEIIEEQHNPKIIEEETPLI